MITQKNMTRDECKERATEQLVNAINKDQFFVAVFSVEGDVVTLEETSCEFPMKHHRAAFELLEQALRNKIPLIPTQLDDLPLAKHLQNGGESNEATP